MLPEYSDNRLKLSFLSPILISICSALYMINYFMSLLIVALETFFFWALMILFVEIFLHLNNTEREVKWKEMAFYTNIVLLPLFLTGCLLPAVRNYRDSTFPSDNSWESIESYASNPLYQFYVIFPVIIPIIVVVLIILLLSIVIYEVHEVEFLKAILFSTAIGILSFTISTVLAGLFF